MGGIIDFMKKELPKLIVILGPTASGKSGLAIKLAKKFKGEVISADSRQVYKYMNIGTAKTTKQEMKGIKHYMIDIVKPDEVLSLAQYKDKAVKLINNISKRGKTPFLVGGTGLYVSAIVDNWLIPQIEPNKKLRRELESKTNQWLFNKLKKLDPTTAKRIDSENKRRLVRALEVCLSSGRLFSDERRRGEPLFDVLEIGIKLPRRELYQRINNRVDLMVKQGLLNEVKKLVKSGYKWNLPAMSGIGYRQIGMYLRGEINLEESIALIKRDTRRYAKRQMTWFRRDKKIKWIKNYNMADKLIVKFLK
jgi:tRNA dimethylallyltransferase